MPKKRRPGQIPDRTPGLLHAITARAWSPCLYARFAWRCPVPVWKHRAWRSPPNRIACMCAPGVASRCISAAAVIGVRFTAPGTAPRCGGMTRASAPPRVTRQAVMARSSMRPGSADGVRARAMQNKERRIRVPSAMAMPAQWRRIPARHSEPSPMPAVPPDSGHLSLATQRPCRAAPSVAVHSHRLCACTPCAHAYEAGQLRS